MSQPQGSGTLVDILADRLVNEPAPDEQTDDRAELIAGLRAIADWFEQHPEIAPPTFPNFTVSVGQSGEWTTDDTEGWARMDTFAAALGAEVRVGDHLDTERKFGSVMLRAYFITSAARVAS